MNMKSYSGAVSTRDTPQTEKIPGSSQVKNNAGGFGWAVDDWQRLRRFLILGSEGGTYYQDDRKLTVENAEAVLRCLSVDGERVVRELVEISHKGLAPKNDPAIFVLAMASAKGSDKTRRAAFDALPDVCRIGTHLFAFAEARQAFGGWGRGMRNAVKNWYLKKSAEQLALQLAKYQSRNGWSNRDLLRLSHPKSKDESVNAMFKWAVGKEAVIGDGAVKQALALPALIVGMAEANDESTGKKRVIELIEKVGLTREMVRTDLLSDPDVQWALMQKQGLTALIRNLGNYSKSGLLKPMSAAEQFVVARLSDAAALHKARVHPFAVLMAARTYAAGRGLRGRGEWTTCPNVVDALDDAFYAAFENVEPTGKRHLLGIDVSSSMESPISGSLMSSAEAAAAMAMVTFRSEAAAYAFGFANDFRDLKLSRKLRLDAVLETTRKMNFGSTDCALPMKWALANKVAVDQFIVYTDNETWSGRPHPKQALDEYRQKTGTPARLATVAFSSGGFTIADPDDAGMLDCVGLDASLPQVLSAFAKSEV